MTFGCINNLQIGHVMGSFGTEFRFRNEKTGKLDGGFVPVDFAMNAASYGCKTYKVTTAEELKADLIVIGSHGRKGFQKFFLGSFAQDVLGQTELPILIVKQ